MRYDFHTDILPLKNQLYRLALRLTQDSAEAEDVVQETMLRVWKARDTWDAIDNIEAFCLTVCRNIALDSLRRHGNRTVSLDAAGDCRPAAEGLGAGERATAEGTPSDKAIRRNQVEIVRRIIDALPEKQRSCVQLRDFEGKTYKEIAAVLGITEDQVKVNIFRGRQAIKQRFLAIDGFSAAKK